MPGLFSFIGNEWDDVIQHPDLLLPGIERISVIYWSGRQDQLKALTRGRQGNLIDDYNELLTRAEVRLRLQKFRSSGKAFEWIRADESPLEPEPPNDQKTDLFTELQNTILILRYKNENDGKYDALLVYLSKNLNQFGPTLNDKILSVENKSIIGHILYNYFNYIHRIHRHNHDVLQSIRQTVQSVHREYFRMKDEIRQVTMGLEEQILNLSLQHLQTLSEKYQREYSFSGEALEKLKSFRGNIRHLPAIIEQAVIFMENISGGMPEFDGRLDAPAISFDNFQVEREETVAVKRIDSRESRTLQLLDKLEKAALMLKSKDIPLTGTNIGHALPQPISAPAITDALKKHRTTIIHLLKKYPQKWEVIREEFRPVRNLFKQERELTSREGIA